MITRIWHGRTKKEDADLFRHYVIETGVRDYLKIQGNLDARLLQRDEGEVTHIWMVTLWQELECIRAFAGDDIDKARYYPEDEKYLLELEPHVLHCRTFSFSSSRIKNFIQQLEQLYGGGSWNDENFTGKLKAVDEQKAFLQPIPGKHCIAEIVWHCTYWRTVLFKQLQGDDDFRERTLKDQNFLSLESLQRKGWSNLLADFKESQELLIALLNTKNDDFLESEYKEGKTFDYSIEGIIHHDIYHLGQIGLVISLLNT
jgi:uncharacterized damage-inducible protein DinB